MSLMGDLEALRVWRLGSNGSYLGIECVQWNRRQLRNSPLQVVDTERYTPSVYRVSKGLNENLTANHFSHEPAAHRCS